MKVTRKMLLTITAGLGVLIIVYSLVRHFTGFGLSEAGEKYLMDVVIICALGLFMYNRKMARDEKRAREEAAEAERRAAEGPPEEPEESPDDENLPHWERHKKTAGSADDESADEDGDTDEDEEYEEDEP